MTVPQPVPGKHLFVSYSRKDKPFVDRLMADLQSRGMTIWIDNIGLKPGTRNWESGLRTAIREACAVLLVASPDSRQSNYVADEVSIAEMYKVPVYPVWAAGSEWLDSILLGYGRTQHVDARGDRYEEAITRILAAIGGFASSSPERVAQPTSRRSPVDSDASTHDRPPRNPYKGLQAFTADDTGDFFGREAFVETLAERVTTLAASDERFLAIVGASGSGKSSLVMAGLIPRLKIDHPDWRYFPPIKPGAHPLEALSLDLIGALGGSSWDQG